LIEFKLSVHLIACGMSPYNDRTTVRLGDGLVFEKRLPGTKAD